jgi:hypothetical protein
MHVGGADMAAASTLTAAQDLVTQQAAALWWGWDDILESASRAFEP